MATLTIPSASLYPNGSKEIRCTRFVLSTRRRNFERLPEFRDAAVYRERFTGIPGLECDSNANQLDQAFPELSHNTEPPLLAALHKLPCCSAGLITKGTVSSVSHLLSRVAFSLDLPGVNTGRSSPKVISGVISGVTPEPHRGAVNEERRINDVRRHDRKRTRRITEDAAPPGGGSSAP
ncbi:hypothetical protein EYF80_036744 [Liparis tanakae]|uniref:Uncharacterized protein n=1 Tax=Liparis tanakae TaxID=230148 RepID=A0A4Z2GIM7_9TELE|nr:hypothetical protein EYF80_036744 [Liparis tanakae]